RADSLALPEPNFMPMGSPSMLRVLLRPLPGTVGCRLLRPDSVSAAGEATTSASVTALLRAGCISGIPIDFGRVSAVAGVAPEMLSAFLVSRRSFSCARGRDARWPAGRSWDSGSSGFI
ncbi:unnamed protein product, partial [Ectocarpus sp. 4 AP-2014]